MSNTKNPYEQTIHDLELRRDNCLQELTKLDQAITALRAAMTVSIPITQTVSVHITAPPDDDKYSSEEYKYSNMSVRWAVLKFLSASVDRWTTADISDALLSGGNKKASKATVSAVISDMVKKRQELTGEDGGYQLTETGHHAWNAIVHSFRYKNPTSSATQQ
jgi:hypothetical protein